MKRDKLKAKEGIFWLVRGDGEEKAHLLICSYEGTRGFIGNSKSGKTYTHQLTWCEVAAHESRSVRNKSWNYFPRGRVTIKNNQAKIFLNPNIAKKEYIEQIVEKFCLRDAEVKVIVDNSRHYACGIFD